MSSPKTEKKKVKKKKSKSIVPTTTESSMVISSPESKGKKKKAKTPKSPEKKKKSKKSPKKERKTASVQESQVSIDAPPLHTAQPLHIDEKDDMLLSDGEPSLQDAKSVGTLEDDIDDEDDLDMEGRQMYDNGPPIGEILACGSEEDNVSDIGEDIVTDGPPSTEIIDGVQIYYNPRDNDVCFDDRHHPGTMDWISTIRECLDRFEGQDYSPPVYRAIKKQLKGRKFLVRARSNVRTSWREATKPEIIELFGEAFNEERRRMREGISDDDSGVDSSLQNSAAQSDTSLSVGDIADEVPVDAALPLPSPTSRPTPRASNQEGVENSASPYNFDGDSDNDSDADMDGTRKTRMSESTTKSESHLLHAMREVEVAEEYARPFDDVALLMQGIAAEEKLRMLLQLSKSSRTVALKSELEKLEELSKKMKAASLAPLLDVLTKMERHVTDYYNSMAEMHSSSMSLQISASELNHVQRAYEELHRTNTTSTDAPPSSRLRSIDDDPRSDIDTDREGSHSNQGRHRRTINVSSHHKKPDRSKSSKDGASSSPSKSKSRSGSRESSPSKSKSRSGSRDSSDVLHHSAMSMSVDYDEFGEDVIMTPPATASTEDVDSVSSEGHERMISDANLEVFVDDRSHAGDDDVEKARKDHGDDGDLHSRSVEPQGKKGGQSLRPDDYGGTHLEMELGALSPGDSGFSKDALDSVEADGDDYGSEYSGELKDTKRDGQAYENSIRTADFGGSYREMALDGGYETGDEVATSNADDLGESGFSSQADLVDDAESDQDADEQDSETQERAEEGAHGLHDGELPLKVEEGHVLDIKPDTDDLSSIGRSMPGMYGSDSDSEGGDGDYEEYEISDNALEFEDDDDSYRSYSSDDTEEEQSEKAEHEEKVNPKLDQFFDRLQHFFEVRKKIDERAELMDPSAKLHGLKVKLHSDGIQKKNGKFKKEYQQRNLKGKIVRNLDDLYGPAELARDELSRVVSQLAGEVKGLERESFIVMPVKQRSKAFDKAHQEYTHRSPGPPESWVYDIVRASIYCKSYKQIADVSKWIGKNANIVTSKNRFKEPCFNGYRDLLFHVSIPYKDDLTHICEIQVHHKDMKALDLQFGMPKHYEYFRSAFAGHWRSEPLILEDLGMLNKYGEISGQCMVKLLKSKDPHQLRLFARLCRDKLDEFDRALELYRRILMLQEATLGDDNDEVADTYLGLGMVLGALGQIDESLMNLERALAIKESLLGTEHLEVADTYTKIGHMLCQKGDYHGALKKYRDALKVRESNLGKDNFLVIRSLQDIGNALRDTGDFKASEGELRRALTIQEAVLGVADVDVAATRSMIGVTLCDQGDYSRAMEEHRMALAIFETKLGKNSALTADAHNKIGIVLCQRGEYEVAEWRHRKALRIHEAISGKDAEACAVSLTHLGEVLKRKGDNDGAIKALKRACKIREDHLGMDHPVTAGSHLDLGKVYVNKRKYDQALEESRKAKVVRESFLGQLHPLTAEAYNYVGNALSLKGDHEAAILEQRQALEVYESVLGKNHPKTATGYQFLADALLAMGDKDDALNEHRRALAVRAGVLNKDHPDTALSCSRIGDLLSQKGDLVGALVACRQALAITVGLCGEDHPESATGHIQVAKVLAAAGDFTDAMQEAQQALKIREKSLGKDHPDTARAHGVLGTLHSMMGDHVTAKKFHKRSMNMLDRKLGKKHASTKAAQKRMKASEKQEDVDIFGVY
jgi:tetratricopeptide (TPR) repeat protein